MVFCVFYSRQLQSIRDQSITKNFSEDSKSKGDQIKQKHEVSIWMRRENSWKWMSFVALNTIRVGLGILFSNLDTAFEKWN